MNKKQAVKCTLIHEDPPANKKPKFETKSNPNDHIPKVAEKCKVASKDEDCEVVAVERPAAPQYE